MKYLKMVLTMLMIGLLTACGGANDSDQQVNDVIENSAPLTEEEFHQMYVNPNAFIGRVVEFYARIFITPERNEDGIYIQAFAKNNPDRNTIITIQDSTLNVTDGDIIRVTGTVEDVFEGENLFGGTIIAPFIVATDIEISDYANAFSPAIHTIEVNQSIEQHEVTITVEKIEIAEEETRVYITVKNDSLYEFDFFTWNQRATIGNTQLDIQDNWEANYPEVQSNLLPGIESSGIIVFPKFEGESVRLFLDGNSNNWELDFDTYIFEINLN